MAMQGVSPAAVDKMLELQQAVLVEALRGRHRLAYLLVGLATLVLVWLFFESRRYRRRLSERGEMKVSREGVSLFWLGSGAGAVMAFVACVSWAGILVYGHTVQVDLPAGKFEMVAGKEVPAPAPSRPAAGPSTAPGSDVVDLGREAALVRDDRGMANLYPDAPAWQAPTFSIADTNNNALVNEMEWSSFWKGWRQVCGATPRVEQSPRRPHLPMAVEMARPPG